MNTVTFSRAPVRSKSLMKKLASSWVIPIAANITANSASSPSTLACLAIWAANSLWGKPEPEKIGSFWPLTKVFIPSMVEIPVWINSSGNSREAGFIGLPLISNSSSGIISGPPSIGLPIPLNIRPIISLDTPILAVWPVNLALVFLVFKSVVPSNTWITATSSVTSRTCPLLFSPLGVSISTISL